jgi:prevent-host-death family protein
MTKVGAYHAKTHFAALLERVARGERIVITKHGVSVAHLVPPPAGPSLSRDEAIDELLQFRRGRRASRRTVRRWIEEGRT